MSGKSRLAVVLTACYIGACVGSLWDRGDAILYFAIVSSATLWVIFPPMASRFAFGLVLTAIGIAIGVGLPVVGDGIDIVGFLVLLVIGLLKAQRMFYFFARLPLGATCFGLYAILWSAAKSLPSTYSMSVHHGALFYIVAVLLAAIAGILPLLIIAFIYSFFDVSPATVVIYTVGYPFYLALFILTWLFGGEDSPLLDS